MNWKPSADRTTLIARARMLARLRFFFNEQSVLEVETPLLNSSSNPDPFIDCFEVSDAAGSLAMLTEPYFLQSSPEFAMKRLLASGSGSIYQICKSFRQSESGRRHNPEFTMLEWYMVDWSLEQLMDQVDALLSCFFSYPQCLRVSYHELFFTRFQINPHTIDLAGIRDLVKQYCSFSDVNKLDKDACLNLLMSEMIEPELGTAEACIVFDYPVSQAALAEVQSHENGYLIAKRFEVYLGGVELANAYQELLDEKELRVRFEKENSVREQMQKNPIALDEHLLAGMSEGIPKCAGIAMGLDRLLMLIENKKYIAEVLSFDFDRA